MDHRQLKYFVAVYERRNLSHAAQQCYVAQSALSRHITSLESELGSVLFERVPRGMEPTAAGIRLYEHARTILSAIAAAERDLKHGSTQIAGEIVIGMPFSAIEGIGLPLMERVRAQLPQARVVLHEMLSYEMFDQLLSGAVNIALYYNAWPDSGVTLTPLLIEELYCVGRADLLGEDRSAMRFEELLALPHLMLKQGNSRSISTQTRLLQNLHEHAVMEINSINGLRKALIAGIGCILSPKITVRDLLASGQLMARPVIEPTISRTLYLGRTAQQSATPLGELMRRMILELIAEEVDGGAWEAKLISQTEADNHQMTARS
ncbi:LysR family transcriptional regulator [Steroidobacter sp.]|uniref:LysR family transcriptional regulator n=1 Tax=Steroidobacter sp. TaxID=1978227 RepID=UPI001A5B0962|nr:LysR family transcriptional regulator [Steroidobacter sp.]MBL8265802.1 LysR family transcriptional regulator [Steroidobacter sp.]